MPKEMLLKIKNLDKINEFLAQGWYFCHPVNTDLVLLRKREENTLTNRERGPICEDRPTFAQTPY